MANNLTTSSTRTDLNSEANDFFNNYLQPGFTISSDINGIILAQFEQITQNKESALILASCVIYTSLAQRIDPMIILDKVRSMNNDETLAYLGLFLNLNRVGTSYLGVRNRPKISKYVERTILP